jgi:predicted transcriptional regulator
MAHIRWTDLKKRRPLTAEGQRAYNEASLAIAVADQVRQLRSARGMSQEELARRANTTQPVIARLERGGQPPSLRTLERLAEALNADLTVRLTARAGL